MGKALLLYLLFLLMTESLVGAKVCNVSGEVGGDGGGGGRLPVWWVGEIAYYVCTPRWLTNHVMRLYSILVYISILLQCVVIMN